MRLGQKQKDLLVELYQREEEEYARWRDSGGLPLAGIPEERSVGLEATGPETKAPAPNVAAPWSALLRRMTPEGASEPDGNLARMADALEARGLIWISPPKEEGRRRLRKACGLEMPGRVEAQRELARRRQASARVEQQPGTRFSAIVKPHHERWRSRRTKLEGLMRDYHHAVTASTDELAKLHRDLAQARALQEYAAKVLPQFEIDHADPDPPDGVRAVLTVFGSIREVYSPLDAETLAIMGEMVRDVVRRAESAKRSNKVARIRNQALGQDED